MADTPISLVVPYAPGGAADSIARLAQHTISKATGKTVVLEYKTGAGGRLATQYVANSPKSKLVLMLHTINLPIDAAISEQSYNELDIVPLINFGSMPLILVTGEKGKFANIAEFKKLDSTTPINYGSSGIFSVSHLSGEILRYSTNKNLAHIPYQGQAKTIVDLISGNLDSAFLHPDIALPQIETGKLIPIAVTSQKRIPQLNNIPTFKEVGISGLEISGYFVLASNRTDDPKEYLELREAVSKALESHEEANLYKSAYLEQPRSPVLAENFFIVEKNKFKELIKKLKLNVQ